MLPSPTVLPSSGAPAGYGRSCTNCSKAKCRCVMRREGGSCERCHRLGKECQKITGVRKRTSKKTPSSRTAQLEEKLEDIVTMLRSTQTQTQEKQGLVSPQSQPSSISPPSPISVRQFANGLDSLAAAAAANNDKSEEGMICEYPCSILDGSNSSDSSNCSNSSNGSCQYSKPITQDEVENALQLSVNESETRLAHFRAWLIRFPIMHIPQHVTAHDFMTQHPFLWLSILTITTPLSHTQLLFREKFRQEICRRIVMNHERSMDLLWGLLTYLTWATSSTGPGVKPFLVLYTQLAATILYDMGLTKAPHEDFSSCFAYQPVIFGASSPPKQLSNEERRALLTLWFTTSTIASFSGRMDAMIWTSFMDDCLKVLTFEGDGPLDGVFVALIRIQVIGEEAQKLLRADTRGDYPQGPTHIFKAGLVHRLHEVRDSLSPEIFAHNVVRAQYHHVEAHIHSIGLFTNQQIPVATRVASMHSCAKAVRAWFDNYLCLPLDQMVGMPFSIYVSMSRLQVTLLKLTVLEDPAWDKEILRSTANLLDLMDCLCEHFSKIAELGGTVHTTDVDGSSFATGAAIMKKLRDFWEPALSRHLRPEYPVLPQDRRQYSVVNQSPEMHHGLGMSGHSVLDFQDTTWVTDVLGPWEF